jgi:hypothetical protein
MRKLFKVVVTVIVVVVLGVVVFRRLTGDQSRDGEWARTEPT